jgi:replicative DNA helicase
MADIAVREPPRSLEAERSVLGSVLIKPSVIDSVGLELQVDDFVLPAHREIFDAMLAIARRDRTVDVVVLADELKSREMLKRLEGGEGYLLKLANETPTAENIAQYVAIVKERSQLRRVIATCLDTASRAYGSTEVAALLDEHAGQMLKISTGLGSDLVPIAELTDPLMEEFENRFLKSKAGESSVTGIKTGITRLDVITAGLQPEQVITIAGDTGGGKTALAMQIATNCAEDPEGVAIVFNLEMSRAELGEREFVHVSRLNSQKLKHGALDHDDFKRLHGTKHKIDAMPLYLEKKVDSMRLIEARCRRLRAKYPNKKKVLGVLDTLQLMGNSGPKDNRAREIGMISKWVKRMAGSLGMTWIMVSQLNREGAKAKKDKEGNVLPPTIHDLKESGDIEQDSDIILLTHNPDEIPEGDVDLYLGKHRNGRRARIRVHWSGKTYRFSDPEIDMGPPPEDRRYVD